MKLSWKKTPNGNWTARSAPPPHLGLYAQLSRRPDKTWHWEIRAVPSPKKRINQDLAGHWDNGKLIKQCTGVCDTVKKAMTATETDMDDASVRLDRDEPSRFTR
jgi:hypothetical protein